MLEKIFLSIIILGTVGFFFAVLLAFLSKKLKVEDDPRIENILKLLPGANCGACGFSGCRAFAEAVVKNSSIFSGCIPGRETVNNAIIKLLGFNQTAVSQKIRVICRCQAEEGKKKISSLYNGPKTCKAANLIGGAVDCFYGCLAFGDCLKFCPVKAISLINKRIEIDEKKCIGCRKCVRTCPRNLFEAVPLKKEVDLFYVACNNKNKGKDVMAVCSKGCITCGICAKVNDSPFYIKNNLSYIDYAKIDKKEPLEEAKNKCPTKCILAVSDVKRRS